MIFKENLNFFQANVCREAHTFRLLHHLFFVFCSVFLVIIIIIFLVVGRLFYRIVLNSNVRIRTIGEGATEQESGVAFAPVVSSVRLILETRIELH